jgi:hypothetical protein
MTLACLTLVLAADLPLVTPEEFATQLRAKGEKPAIFYIGFAVLYRKHITGAVMAGPTSRAEGLAMLKTALEKVPHDREVVLYCGCCPWEMCPNVKPAVELVQGMGFKRARVVRIDTNLATDWIDHGYPTEQQPDKK